MHETGGARRAAEAGRPYSETSDHSDAAWGDYVRGCARQDGSALAKLYDESSALVFSIALKVLSNEADSEEVTLDVYSQVWRSASAYNESRGSVAAWLVTIARSRAIDKIRARTARALYEESVEGFARQATNPEDPERRMAIRQRHGRVVSALNALTADQKLAIELAFFSGLSHSELAVRLNAPLGTVKTRIRLGMVKMRELLGELSGD